MTTCLRGRVEHFTLYATKIMDVIWELRNQVQHNGSNLNLNELPSKVTKRSHEHRLRILVSLPKILVMQDDKDKLIKG